MRRAVQTGGRRRNSRMNTGPQFVVGSVGDVVAERLRGELSQVYRDHEGDFPRARLRDVVARGGNIRKDRVLLAWAGAFESSLNEVLVAAARRSFERGVNDNDEENRDSPLAVVSERGASFSEARGDVGREASEETQRLIEKVWELVETAINDGQSPEDIVASVEGFLRDKDDYRARRVAWSVVFRYWHEGRHWENLRRGARHKIWHTSPLVDNCPLCVGNVEALEIEVDETFPSGHQHPLAHPWCHCWLEYTGFPE